MDDQYLFDLLADLYDDEKYPELEVKCQEILNQLSSDDYQEHIVYSFLALAQIRNKLPEMALKNAELSLKYSKSCPWSRWVMLYALEANIENSDSKSIKRAIKLGKAIIRDGSSHIKKDSCTAGLPYRSQLALLNDSRFLLAFVYMAADNLIESRKLLTKYLEEAEDTDSDFESAEAERELKKMMGATS